MLDIQRRGRHAAQGRGTLDLLPECRCDIGIGVLFERLVRVRPGRVVPRDFVKRYLERLQEGKLETEEERTRSRDLPLRVQLDEPVLALDALKANFASTPRV